MWFYNEFNWPLEKIYVLHYCRKLRTFRMSQTTRRGENKIFTFFFFFLILLVGSWCDLRRHRLYHDQHQYYRPGRSTQDREQGLWLTCNLSLRYRPLSCKQVRGTYTLNNLQRGLSYVVFRGCYEGRRQHSAFYSRNQFVLKTLINRWRFYWLTFVFL